MAQKGRRVYILLKSGKVMDVWSNLKHLCEDMDIATNQQFVSYSKLSKMDKEAGVLSFTGKNDASYSIIIKFIR